MSIETWGLSSSRSRISFAVRHLVFSKTRGGFNRWYGTLAVPDGDFSRATVEVVIDASSIDTGVLRRDKHLRSEDYLDVKRYPDITFISRRVHAEPGGRFRVIGVLTIRSVTREVTLDVESIARGEDRRESDRVLYSATAAFDRRAFEFTGNPALDSGGLVIGERIEVEIEVEAVRQPAERVA